MKVKQGVLFVSHSKNIARGISDLVSEVSTDVSITFSGGTEDGEIGTDLMDILSAIEENEAEEILAFYDLGSSKINLEIALDMTDKKVHIYDVAFVEGSYTATALLQAGVGLEEIENQLSEIKIK